MVKVFLGLGTNVGDREENLRQAVQRLEAEGLMRIDRLSSIYETAPVGYTDQADLLNIVLSAWTELQPQALLRELKAAEQALGREPGIRWGPRRIDLDILLYGEEAVETPELVIPHPRLAERGFVLIPLAEIAPDLALPGGERVADLAARAGMAAGVQRWKAWPGPLP